MSTVTTLINDFKESFKHLKIMLGNF